MTTMSRETALERLFEAVDRNTAALDAIEDVVERRVSKGRWESVLAWSRIGAVFATENPTTTFRSLRIEKALDAVSCRMLPPVPRRSARRRVNRVESVLHVLSEGPSTGGHLRYAVRWVGHDDKRSSSFAVTRPGMDPPILHEVAARHGGDVAVLTGSTIERAGRLRALVADFDVVVCHTHMDDLVPSLAFGGEYDGPPVVLMNHADHVFNLGAGNVSVLVTPRATGADFAVRARSYPLGNSLVLPIPMAQGCRRMTRRDAKIALGIDPERTVAVSLARSPKYLPSPLGEGFVEVVSPVFAERDALMMVVGPSADQEPFGDAGSRFGHRLRVEGMQPNPDVHLDAADVYVDSIPFCSNTSSLEAGLRGTPIITFRPHRGFQRLHSSEGLLDDVVVAPATIDEHRIELARLLDDEAHRMTVGSATAEAVRETHGPAAWRGALEGLYVRVLGAQPVVIRTPAADGASDEIRRYAAALAGIETLTPLLWPIMAATKGKEQPLFDGRDRISESVRTTVARLLTKVSGQAWSGPDRAALLVPGSRALLTRT